MFMNKLACHYLLAGLFALLSCAALAETVAPEELNNALQEQAAASWRENRLAFGKEIYDKTCFACHGAGINGAPAIGDQQAWSKRSPLWSAVLFEHSKAGYLEMPAKGANPELTDQEVDAASEYMLSTTFPKMPLD
jgi:cytochrome c5